MIVALIVLSLLAVFGSYRLGVALKTLKTVQASHRKVAERRGGPRKLDTRISGMAA